MGGVDLLNTEVKLNNILQLLEDQNKDRTQRQQNNCPRQTVQIDLILDLYGATKVM